MLTAALGVVKVKRLLEVSGHQRVMHGSRPRDGSSPVVKVRAKCPGPGTATDMKCVCVHIRRDYVLFFILVAIRPDLSLTVCCQVLFNGPAVFHIKTVKDQI